MAVNKTKCSWVEQRPVIKFLVAKKCKQCEIYRDARTVNGTVACLGLMAYQPL